MKRRRNKPNERTKLKSKNVTNDNNKIIIIVIKKNVKRNLWKSLNFEISQKDCIKTAIGYLLKKNVFLEFPQGVETRTSGFRGI
mgnify:CR=1 FL=1